MFFLKSGNKFAIAITISLIIIGGCATSADKRVPMVYSQKNDANAWPDTQLEKRFQEYWFNRFVAGRVKETYQFETPYVRDEISFGKYNNYVKHTPNHELVSVVIQGIDRESDFLVSISCEMRMQTSDGKPVSTPIIDRWVFTGNNWYHVIKDPILLSF